MRQSLFLLVLLILSSCSANREERTSLIIDLKGEKVEIASDASLFEIVYVDDSLLIASVLSPAYKLVSYRINGGVAAHEFLRIGRGPMEVINANIKSRGDTLFVLSSNPNGLQGLIKIPVSGIEDMSQWDSSDYYAMTGISVGRDFDVLSSSEYIMVGGKFGDETVLSVLSEENISCEPFPFWPEDNHDVGPIAKQGMYIRGARVFSNGDKLFYACGEGRYFSILDMSTDKVSETFIYDEYPEYQVASDGVNPRRRPNSKLGGIAYATDSLIFLSLLDCQIANGKYIPEDYKGYPPYYSDRIEVYDWNGKYICTYSMDVPFSTFYVKGDIIYTLSINKETMYSEVYRYSGR